MPKDIAKEIDEMASTLEKATMDPKETLFKTLNALGKEGIKARLPHLSQEEKGLLKSSLEEMAKAKSVEFDKEAQGAKVIQGNIMDTKLQEEIANDDADEKLVKPEAAKHSPQGNSVDGWDGQVIKAEACKDCKDGKKCDKHMEKGAFKKLENELSDEKGVKDPAGLAADIGREKMGKEAFDKKAAEGKKMKKSTEELLEQMTKSEDVLVKAIGEMRKKGIDDKKIESKLEEKGMDKEKVKKAMDKEQAGRKLLEMEEKEHGTKDPKKVMAKEKEEQAGKKEMMASMKKAVINKEEDQLGDTDQMTEEGKDLGDALHTGEDNKKVQKEVNSMKVEGQMKKSFSWSDEQRLLKSYTGGRNFTFNVGDFVEAMIKADDEMKERMKIDEDEEENEEKEDKIEKKKGMMKKSEDLNDLIAKGLDTTWIAEDMKKSLEQVQKDQTGRLVKSFDDQDMASILGLSEEEAKKILG